MKKLLIIALCLLAVFAVVSCKNEPKADPKPESFTVKFDTQGGSAIADASVVKDAVVEKPADPSKEGAIFYTWFTEDTFENVYDFTTPVTQSITLYAKWVNAPAAEKQTINVAYATDTVKLTATVVSDGFQMQWLFDSQVKAGDVLSFKYKSNREFSSITVRKMQGSKSTNGNFFKGEYAEDEADEAGWHTFTYTVTGDTVAADIGIGLRLEITGKNAVGDVLYLKDISYTTATATNNLAFDTKNVYYGAEPTIERHYYRLVATEGGIPGETGDTNYYQDKFRLAWNPNVTVKAGDVLTVVYKAKRNDPATADRDFTFSLREDSMKWIYEADSSVAYPGYWQTVSEPDADGWITLTYTFPPAGTAVPSESTLSYPSTFVVDFRDQYFAAANIGHEADIVYIRSVTLTTTPDAEAPAKTVTSTLILDEDKVSDVFACPEIEEYYAAPAE